MDGEPPFMVNLDVSSRDYTFDQVEVCEPCDRDISMLLSIIENPEHVATAAAVKAAEEETEAVGRQVEAVSAIVDSHVGNQTRGLIPEGPVLEDPEDVTVTLAESARVTLLERVKKLEFTVGKENARKVRHHAGIGKTEPAADLDDADLSHLYDRLCTTYPGAGAGL